MSDNSLAETVSLMGRSFVRLSEAQVCASIVSELQRGHGGWVLTANVDILRRWVRSPDFRKITRRVNVCVADGAPVVLAARLQATPLPERITGADLLASLSESAANANRSIYLLGGAPGTADKAAQVLQQRFPSLCVAGCFCPAPGFENSQSTLSEIQRRLHDAAPDIVYVALGSPKQEWLIERFIDEFPRTWWLGVGASFSFMAGDIMRAPRWMQTAGFEWLHRLAQEPGRLSKRYLVDDLPFLLRLFARALVLRLTRRHNSN